MTIIMAAATSYYAELTSIICDKLKPGYTIMRSNSIISASISKKITEEFPEFSQEDMVPSLTGGYSEEKIPVMYKDVMSTVFGPVVVLTCEDKLRAFLRLFQNDGFVLSKDVEWMKKHFYIAIVDTEDKTVSFISYSNKKVAV